MGHLAGIVPFAALLLAGCVTSGGWKQTGKTEQDQKRDNGECRAQANQTCNGSGFCVNKAYGNCMEGRGWAKE